MYLDIDCGTGNYTNALQKVGFHFIGIDPSNKMLEKAKLKNPKIDKNDLGDYLVSCRKKEGKSF
ncbi:hypothetical protein GCM10023314_31870 [Algibacter agarivorans]|uniref:Methyltransferase domain-containing protein n=1 Tax=Algibacter agarivorans TaxID=1109741 RepID=A0ABP9H0H0_9FLAO